jgi:toxin ParE1/3/4
MRRYRLTFEAERDLNEIADFVAARNPAAAQRLVNRMEARCKALAGMPGMGRPREELARNLRSSHVAKYVVFYRSTQYGIDVIRIIHGARDIPKLLNSASGAAARWRTTSRRKAVPFLSRAVSASGNLCRAHRFEL